MSPHPGFAAVSAGLHALCLLASCLWVDGHVCLGPVFLSLGLCPFGSIDIVCLRSVSLFPDLSSYGCLGLSSGSPGLPVIGLVGHPWCARVCIVPSSGLGLYLPHAVA